MKYNKSKKLFIILIIVIVLILIVGVAYAMLATDMFKSDKDLFFKYANQFFDEDNGFIDNKLEQYNEKKKNSAYENEGKFTANIASNDLSEELSDFSISFSGKNDNVNKRTEQSIKINYSDDINFPIEYKKIDDFHAIKSNEVSKRYFGIKEDEITKLFSKLNGSESPENKAKAAKIKEEISYAKDSVSLKLSSILSEFNANKDSNEDSSEKSLMDMILDEKYEADNVTISAKSDDENGGTITIISDTDPTYAAIGNVSTTGSVQWDFEYGTYSKSGNKSNSTSDSIANKNIFDLSSINLTKEEKNKLKNTYLPIIKNNINNSNFTKVSTTQSEGYSLELSKKEFNENLIKLLETLKDDELLLDKLSSMLVAEFSTSNIDKLINNINQSESEDGKIIITIYQSKDKLNKIEIQLYDQIRFSITKNSSDDDVAYNFDIESQSYSINLNMRYSGLQNIEQVQENYTIMFNNGESYSYNIENKVDFSNDEVSIEDFEENTCIDLNKLSSEKLIKLLNAIVTEVQKVNSEKIRKAEIEGSNPLIDIIPWGSQLFGNYNQANVTQQSEEDKIEDKQENKEQKEETSNENKTNTENTIAENTTSNLVTNSSTSNSKLVSDMEKVTKESFNEKFTQYEGENVKGTTVKSLIMQVIANNMIEDGRKIEVTGDIKLTGNEVPDSIEKTKFYKVKSSTGTDGYVNKVNITEKK